MQVAMCHVGVGSADVKKHHASPSSTGLHGDLDGEINIGDIVAISDYIMRKAW